MSGPFTRPDVLQGLAAGVSSGDPATVTSHAAMASGLTAMQGRLGNAAVVQMLRLGQGASRVGVSGTSVVQRAPQERPEREVSSRAARRLRLGGSAIRHVKRQIADAGNQWEALVDTEFNSYLRMLVMRQKAFWDTSKLRRRPDSATLTAAKAAHAHGGNCGEHADIAYAYLRAHAEGQYIRSISVKDFDHAWVLIGKDDEPDSEWVAVDAWPTSPRACLWDDHFAYTANRARIETNKAMTADGKDSVEHVRSQIKLTDAGKDVIRFDLHKFAGGGWNALVEDLQHYGIELEGEEVTSTQVLEALRQVAAWSLRDVDGWSRRRVELWCASQIDPAVLARVLGKKRSSRGRVERGMETAVAAGRLGWTFNNTDSTADDHDFTYYVQKPADAAAGHSSRRRSRR